MLQLNTVLLNNDRKGLIVSYGEEKLTFDITSIVKKSYKPGNTYKKINEYLKTLPEDDARRFFGIVSRLSRNKDDMSSIAYLNFLKNECRKAIDYLNIARYTVWFRENSEGLYIPDKVHETFDYNADKRETEEKTYIISTYVDFVALCQFVMALFPVFIDYLIYLPMIDNHPHYRIFRLLKDSSLEDSPAFIKLQSYLRVTYDTVIGNSGRRNFIVSYGLPDDEIVDFFTGMTLLNKLAFIDYFDLEKPINPISYTHTLIKYDGECKGGDVDQMKARKPPSETGNEDAYGAFEGLHRPSKVPPGLITEQRSMVNRTDTVLLGLGYDPNEFNWDYYNQECKHIPEFKGYPFDETKLYMLSWFISGTISPQSVGSFDRRKILEILMLAKTCLKEEGLDYIGSFLSSVPADTTSITNSSVIVKGVLSKEQSEEVEKMYRFKIGREGDNLIEKVIINYARVLANAQWRPIGDVNPTYVGSNGNLIPPENAIDVVISYIRFVLSMEPIQ